MRPVASTAGPPAPATPHHGGPALRGQARAAEVHALKAQGLSPARRHWREAAAAPPAPATTATPAVEVSFSAEATAALDAAAAPVEAAPVVDALVAVTAPVEAGVTTADGSVTAAILDAVSTETTVIG